MSKTYTIQMITADEEETGNLCHYGFNVYRYDNKSLVKGMISYMAAILYNSKVTIEMHIQSPTGDSSDFHSFVMPCLTMNQACGIVDEYHNSMLNWCNKENDLIELNERVF